MIPRFDVLGTAVALQLAVAAALLVCYVGFAARRLVDREPARDHALRAVLAELQAGTAPRAPAELERLDPRSRLRVILRAAATASGSSEARLRRIAAAIGLTADAERASRSRFWWRRLEAAHLCSALGLPIPAIRLLLHDPVTAVRAQAVEWALVDPEPATIRTLLGLLDDPEALCRFAVLDTLIRMGRPVVPELARHLRSRSGTGAVAALTVAGAIADAALLPELERLSEDDDPRCRTACLNAFGAVGGVGAAAAVEHGLGDRDPAVREAAARNAALLGQWTAAPGIAPLLRDPTWEVRRAAGYALRSFGAIGQVYLRQALDDPDRFAADMAHQLLDLSVTS